MKFKFSLNTVLKVREHQEKIQKQKLAEQIAKKNEISELQQEVKGKLEAYLKEDKDMEVVSVQSLKRKGVHILQSHQKMEALNQELNAADKKVGEERAELAEAHKKLHIMEKVKEFERNMFTDRIAKDEQKFMDEIATQSFSR